MPARAIERPLAECQLQMRCMTAAVRAGSHDATKPEWGGNATKERPDKKAGHPFNGTLLISVALEYVSRDTAMAHLPLTPGSPQPTQAVPLTAETRDKDSLWLC
jgi:hypothetical protein